MIICACTINAAARAVYRFKHTQVYVIASICMHACMQGTRSCKCARYVMLTERGRSDPRPGARACIAKAISICTYIYIHIQEHICERARMHDRERERERERDACAPRLRECMDRCMHACTCTHAGTPRSIAHACGHTLNYI